MYVFEEKYIIHTEKLLHAWKTWRYVTYYIHYFSNEMLPLNDSCCSHTLLRAPHAGSWGCLKQRLGPHWLPGSDPRKTFFQVNKWRSIKEAQLLFVITVTRKTFKKAALKTSRGFLHQICLEEGIFQSLLIITTSLVVKRLKLRASRGGGGGDGAPVPMGVGVGTGAPVQSLVGELRFLHASRCDQNN